MLLHNTKKATKWLFLSHNNLTSLYYFRARSDLNFSLPICSDVIQLCHLGKSMSIKLQPECSLLNIISVNLLYFIMYGAKIYIAYTNPTITIDVSANLAIENFVKKIFVASVDDEFWILVCSNVIIKVFLNY